MSASVLNSLSFYQLQSYLHSWHAAAASRASKENLSYGTAPSASKCPPQMQPSTQLAVPAKTEGSSSGSGISEMDKAKFKTQLLDLVRNSFSFEHGAQVTLLMSIRLDDRPESLNFEVSEQLLAAKPQPSGQVPHAAPAAPAGGSKRKSQAPQRMVPSGEEDSFVPALAAATAPSRDVSSSFNADFSAGASTEDEEPQPLNLSRNGSPAVGSSSTPLKPIPTPAAAAAATAFQLNNPELAFHQHRQPYLTAMQPAISRIANIAPMSGITAPMVQTSPMLSLANGAALPILAATGFQQQQQQQPQLQQQHHQQQRQPTVRQPRQLGVRSRRPGNRTFPCNQCGIVFQSLAGLSKHTFTTHKVYKCTFCAANFTQRSNLQRHSLKHVGFKPFECRCCRKSYYRKDHLVRHIEVTHPGNDPKLSIDTRLSSAECLQYLERKHESRDYTCLSGVVLSATSAAAAAGSEQGEPAETKAAASAASEAADTAAVAAAASGTEDEIYETQELVMMMDGDMDEEFDEEGEEDLGAEPMDDEEADAIAVEAEEDAEIDVGQEEPQPIMLEQPAAE